MELKPDEPAWQQARSDLLKRYSDATLQDTAFALVGVIGLITVMANHDAVAKTAIFGHSIFVSMLLATLWFTAVLFGNASYWGSLTQISVEQRITPETAASAGVITSGDPMRDTEHFYVAWLVEKTRTGPYDRFFYSRWFLLLFIGSLTVFLLGFLVPPWILS